MTREEILLLVLALEDTCEPVQTRVAKRRGIARRKLAEELRELIGASELISETEQVSLSE